MIRTSIFAALLSLAASPFALAYPTQTITLQPGSVITLNPGQTTTVSCEGNGQTQVRTSCLCGAHSGSTDAVDLVLTTVTSQGDVHSTVLTTYDDNYYPENKSECQSALTANTLCQ